MEGVAIGLGLCLVLALVSRSLSLPPIPFYILGGLAIGRSGFALVEPSVTSDCFTGLGLIFLLFYVGLELKPGVLLRQRGSLLRIGLVDLQINLIVGFVAALALGFSLYESFVVAAAFYVSSSAIAFAHLIEHRQLALRETETIVWLMLAEDIIIVLIILILNTGEISPIGILAGTAILAGLFFAISRWGKDLIGGVLDRDDEIPVLLTFSAVICSAFAARAAAIPETVVVIALGAALASTSPKLLERHARPFRDVFLAIFFVFFGISVDLSGNIGIVPIAVLSTLAVVSKLVSGMIIGRMMHGSSAAGIEIWSASIARGEFSIILAALYGSAAVSSTVAALVITTSVIGPFTAQQSSLLKKHLIRFSSRHALTGIRSLLP